MFFVCVGLLPFDFRWLRRRHRSAQWPRTVGGRPGAWAAVQCSERCLEQNVKLTRRQIKFEGLFNEKPFDFNEFK